MLVFRAVFAVVVVVVVVEVVVLAVAVVVDRIASKYKIEVNISSYSHTQISTQYSHTNTARVVEEKNDRMIRFLVRLLFLWRCRKVCESPVPAFTSGSVIRCQSGFRTCVFKNHELTLLPQRPPIRENLYNSPSVATPFENTIDRIDGR